MNLRKVEEGMIVVLIILIILVIMSLIHKSNKKEIEDEEIEITEGAYLGETEIEFINFYKIYDYFENDEKARDCEEYLKEALKDYQTEVDEFDTQNVKLENNKLTFTLKSTISDEEYLVTVSETETILERLK